MTFFRRISTFFLILLTASVPALASDFTILSSTKHFLRDFGDPNLVETYGRSVADIGDLDGDGVRDVAVGVPLYQALGGTNGGAVFIHFLNVDGSVKATTHIDADTSNGPVLAVSDQYGTALAALGDLNGDGVEDIAVGAPGDDTDGPDRGAAYIHFLNTDGSVDSTVKVTQPVADGDGFGTSLALMEDFDDNGVRDVAVGVPYRDVVGTDDGALFILMLNAGGGVVSALEFNGLSSNGPSLSSGDNFGFAVADCGDFNLDGKDDFAATAPGDDTGGSDRGKSYLMLMDYGFVIDQTIAIDDTTLNGPDLSDGDNYGFSAYMRNDLDGDGVRDLVVGVPKASAPGGGTGEVLIHYLNMDGSVKQTVTLDDADINAPFYPANAEFGSGVSLMNDLNGDNNIDLIVGAHRDRHLGSRAGYEGAFFVELLNHPPALLSFVTTNPNGNYNSGQDVNITANYSEPLDPASTLTVTLDTGVFIVLDQVSGSSVSGTYNVGAAHFTRDLSIVTIDTENVLDVDGAVQTLSDIPANNNLDDDYDITINADQDFDNDGITNVAEFDAGTDMNNVVDNDTVEEQVATMISASDATADGAPMAIDLINTLAGDGGGLPLLINVVPGSISDYERAIEDPTSVGLSPYSVPATQAELQAVIDAVNNTEDGDGDGVTNTVELGAFNSGDGNGDGIQDAVQPTVASSTNPALGGSYTTLEMTGCSNLVAFQVLEETSLGSEDTVHDYPYGLYFYRISCAAPGLSPQVRIYFEQEYDTANWIYTKFNPFIATYIDITGVVPVTYGTANVGGTDVTTIEYEITDGGIMDINGAVDGDIVDPGGPGVLVGSGPIQVLKEANKKEAVVGDIITYTVTITNTTATAFTGLTAHDFVPAGFKYVDGRSILDGLTLTDPTGVATNHLIFNIGNLSPGQTRVLKYQTIVGSGVTFGSYTNRASVLSALNAPISNMALFKVEIVADPTFDMSNILGKVFWDRNENGIQDHTPADEGEEYIEEPVGGVKIVMEDGTIITADEQGRFHVPGILPGRHLFRLDERSLPEGFYLTTDKVVIADVTEGLPVKVNFGVSRDEELFKADREFFTQDVKFSQQKTEPKKLLNIALFEEKIFYDDAGRFARPAQFRIFSNYAAFIKNWGVEIVDYKTNRVVKRFKGDRWNMFEPIIWDGYDDQGQPMDVRRQYDYLLYVEDDQGRYDETYMKPLEFVRHDASQGPLSDPDRDFERFWLKVSSHHTMLFRDQILIDGEVIRIEPMMAGIQSVRVMRAGELFVDVPVYAADEKPGAQASGPDAAMMQVVLPKGQYEVLVKSSRKEAAAQPEMIEITETPEAVGEYAGGINTDIRLKKVDVKPNDLFFVAMGDGKIGYNFTSDNIEPARDDKYREGFYSEGKLAYYLKGKIKGKYLVTSSFDSDRDRKELFRRLDPDKYYPVYGDASKIDYQATNTQGNLYLLVEWDESEAVWGNYKVDFNNTELAQFSRTLYGGKVDYQSLQKNIDGQPDTRVVVFGAHAQQMPAHVEYLSTGGSLYYLKHKRVIEGSQRVKLEVRDKINGLVLKTVEMQDVTDYDIDYDNGRIMFWKPIAMTGDSFSIVSNAILDGNPVHVVVDYEYEVLDSIYEQNYGGRVERQVTDRIRTGATFVKENQQGGDYQLAGVDTKAQIGPETNVGLEIAQTKSDAMGSFVSTDGGLSFTQLENRAGLGGSAVALTGDTRLFNRLGLEAQYKWIDADFSTMGTAAQQGKQIVGFGGVYDVSDRTRVTARYDFQELIDDGNFQTRLQVGAQESSTSLIQVVHQIRKWKVTGEYRHQDVAGRDALYESEVNKDGDIVAVRGDYDLNETWDLSVEQQIAVTGRANAQTSIGATGKVLEELDVSGEITTGTKGSGVRGAARFHASDKIDLTTDYGVLVDGGETGTTASVGASAKVNETSSVRTSVGVKDEPGEHNVSSVTVGSTTQVNDKTTSDVAVEMADASGRGETSALILGTTTDLNEDTTVTAQQKLFSGDETGYGRTYGVQRYANGRVLEGSVGQETKTSDEEFSRSNIFGISGDLDENWSVAMDAQRGEVQNHDGTDTTRSVYSLTTGYADRDALSGEYAKNSLKLEYRRDDGIPKLKQLVIYDNFERKLNDAVVVSASAEHSRTYNKTIRGSDGKYTEISVGGAYRPVLHDKWNFLARYTYLYDMNTPGQVDYQDITQEKSHILSLEGIYDINEDWQWVEKVALKKGEEKVSGFDFTDTTVWLVANRLNYKFDEHWMIGGEFRILDVQQAKDMKTGFLMEAAYRFHEYAQLGVGFNFTEFDDDLTNLNYSAFGPFVRLTGTFYDRSAEEIEKDRLRRLETKLSHWAWMIVREELEHPDSHVSHQLHDYFEMAKEAQQKGDLTRAAQLNRDVLSAVNMMYKETLDQIWDRVSQEEGLKQKQLLAEELFSQGKYAEARALLTDVIEGVRQLMSAEDPVEAPDALEGVPEEAVQEVEPLPTEVSLKTD